MARPDAVIRRVSSRRTEREKERRPSFGCAERYGKMMINRRRYAHRRLVELNNANVTSVSRAELNRESFFQEEP